MSFMADIRQILADAKPRGAIAPRGLTHPILLASFLVTGLTLGIRALGGWQTLELLTFDRMVQLRPASAPDPRLLVVTITDADIQRQQNWPLKDAVVAKLLKNLQRQHPRVIGLDIYRDLPMSPGTAELTAQITASNVISITLLGSEEEHRVPPPVGVPNTQVGFSDFVVDPDAVIRRCLLFAKTQDERFYSFALRLSLAYMGKSTPFHVQSNALKLGDALFPVLSPEAGGYQSLDDRGYQMLVDYRAVQPVARQVSLEQVLQGELPEDWVKDKIVLIGTTAMSAKDLFLTPHNKTQHHSPTTPGVLIHAQITSQILRAVLDGQALFWYWSEPWEMLWIGSWALLGGALAWKLRHPLHLLSSIGLAGIGLGGSCFGLFLGMGWVPLAPAAIALVGTTASILAYRLLHDAFHDPLTQLPNRTYFLRNLAKVSGPALLSTPAARRGGAIANSLEPNLALDAPKSERGFAVFSVGLNGFKTINDGLGHPVGDRLLIEMTRRLQTCLGQRDLLARVGGDEFAIVRYPVQGETEVATLAEMLRQQWRYPFLLGQQEVFISASVGVALNPGNLNYLPEEILQDAKTAMHQAKTLGKSGHQVFTSGMRQQRVTRLQLETDLHYALERQEFQLYYQPIVALTSGKIVGFEALIRWQHPRRGIVSPIYFIPAAESTDLIIPLGHWALAEACQQLCQWQKAYPQSPVLGMSVNLSGKQFSQAHLVEEVEQVLQQTGLAAQYLKLEITESVAMTDAETAIAMLVRLRGLNLQLSIDDFGTGYSSLSYLHRFPTSTIKVDRSFVGRMGRNNEENQIVQTIIMLGHNLGMDIVAEGIETPEQLALLRQLGCDYGQGYLFSKPMTAADIELLLGTQPQW
jgi:diguanylate cyclase (GGDEF)-like protein